MASSLVAMTPAVARAIGVDLDAEAIRIGQVKGFAHQVIGHPDPQVERGDVGGKASEGRPIRQQEGQVEQPERAPACLHHAGARLQHH